MILNDFLSYKNMIIVFHITSFYNEEEKILVQTRSQTKTSSTVLPNVHGIDKGIDQKKQVIKPLSAQVQ